MPVQANIIRDFREFSGVDYRSNNITRPERFARDCLNACTDERGNLTMRRGYKPIAYAPNSTGTAPYSQKTCTGVYTFKKKNIVDYTIEEELLVNYDGYLHKLVYEVVTIQYVGGAGTTGYFKMIPVANYYGGLVYGGSYHCQCYKGTTQLLDLNLGPVGGNETPEYTGFVSLATLVAAVDALPEFVCSYSGGAEATNIIAGYHLPITDEAMLNVGFLYLEVGYLKRVTTRTGTSGAYFLSTPETWYIADLEDEVIERDQCGIDLGTCLAIAEPTNGAIATPPAIGNDSGASILKYDGNATYQLGVPSSDSVTAAPVAGGALVGSYYWAATYEVVDAQGNIVEGDLSNEVALTLGGANQQADITIPSIFACRALAQNDYHLDQRAYANNGGVEAAPTFHVDNGAGGADNLEVGMRVCYRDSAGVFREDIIISRTADHIVIANLSGVAHNISNNEFISAGSKINLYRNKAGGTLKFLVRQFAEAPIGITYRDNIADASLGFEYVPPYEDGGHGIVSEPNTDDVPEWFRRLAFGAKYKNLVVWVSLNGEVQFSDPDGPEYYVTAGSTIKLIGKSTQPITGIGATDEAVFVFKSDEITVIRGDLTTGRWSQETIPGVGCDSHYTIANVRGWIWFWSRAGGVCRIRSADWPEKCSYRIDNVILAAAFDEYANIYGTAAGIFPKYARGIYHPEDERYYLYIPAIEQHRSGMTYYNAPCCQFSMFFAADTSDQDMMEAVGDLEGNTDEQVPKIRWWRWYRTPSETVALYPNGFNTWHPPQINFWGGVTIYRGKMVWAHSDISIGGGAPLNRPVFHLVEENKTGTAYDYTDFAEPIPFIYEHGWIYLKEPSVLKKWLRSEVYAFRENLPTPTAFDVTVSIVTDYKDSSTAWSSQTLSFHYDPATSIDDVCERFEFKPIDAKAVKLKFSGVFHSQAPTISGWTTEVAPSFNPHIRK